MDELIPIYRIEFFLDAIVNNTTPPDPIYRAEFYLAKIAGADVEIPEPVYRMEKYLAYLCGEEVELPDPIYRIEYYLASLCGMQVEVPEPIYRVEFWLWDWCGGGGIEKTVTGNPIHILDALAKPAQALSVKLEPVQAGSGDPSPDNVRPISGHTDADVIVSPTLNPADGTTYPIPLGTTVYGGTIDAVNGSGSSNLSFDDLGNLTWYADTNRPGVFYSPTRQTTAKKSGFIIAETYTWRNLGVPSASLLKTADNTISLYPSYGNSYIYVIDTSKANMTGEEFKTAVTGVKFVYELVEPIELTITPTQVELLQGENNIWSDGTMTLVYLADGNASDEEALNILLGGRYVNNHEADEPTDREALNIILGGNER